MRHDVLSVERLPIAPLGHVQQPVRESNPPFRLEGPVSCADRRTSRTECDEQELNLQTLAGWLGYGQLGLPMPNRRMCLSGGGGSRTRRSPRFELGRFSGLRTAPSFSKTPPTGFEPAISCVTGRRALQAAPRGHIRFPVAQVGVEPTASLVLSQGGLPVAYRAACAQSGSRTRKRSGLSRAALPR